VPTNGRLDQQRYRYTRWEPNPLDGAGLSSTEAFTELARRYFRWIGPATVAEFRWFSGLGVKAASAAVEPLGLAPIDDEGALLMFPDDLEAFRAFRPPKDHAYTLVSSLDAISALRRDVAGLLAPADLERQVLADKSRVAAGGISDLPSHAVLDRGRLIGLWEFDPAEKRVVAALFGGADADAELRGAISRTEAFIRDDLGDARSFSLDSPKCRAPRIAALREGL
jgi:hypothetical protein